MELSYIREMHRIDIPSVMDIEHMSFEFPWTPEEFSQCLKRRGPHKNTYGLIAERKEIIVGYLIYQVHKRRVHILNVAVHPDHRRSGVCTQLIGTLLIESSSSEFIKTAYMEVRETNLTAQLTFKNLGFTATSILKDFYDEDCKEDAYMMQLPIPSMITA